MANCEVFKHIKHHGIQLRVFLYDEEFFIPMADILKVCDYRGAGWGTIIERCGLKVMSLAPRGRRGGQLKCIQATKVHKLTFRDGYRMSALDDLVGVINQELNIKQDVMDEKSQSDTITGPADTSLLDENEERIKILETTTVTLSKYINQLLEDVRALNARLDSFENGQCKPTDQLTLADVRAVLDTLNPNR